MKLRIMSDLHLEFGPIDIPFIGEDLLILAGDIQVGMSQYEWFKELLQHRPVLYVLGNHEYYHQDFKELKEQASVFEYKLFKDCSNQLMFLQDSKIVLKGVTFIGATLWTNIPNDRRTSIEHAMNDYRCIRKGKTPYEHLTTEDTTDENCESLAFLERAIQDTEGKLVVITHHAPSLRSIPKRFAGKVTNFAYANDLDDLVSETNLWVHGHTHDSFDYMIDKARVICNPRGYVGHELNPNFNIDLMVEI